MTGPLHLLCAGAVQGLVETIAVRFRERSGVELAARFGAVGAMQEALLAGAPCDVLVLTAALLEAMRDNGRIAGGIAPVGRVRTGIGVRAGDALPPIDTADALRAAFLAAPALHVPDLQASTAGAHVAALLERLGIADRMVPKLQVFPNGAAAMAALARDGVAAGALGCTQLTEILRTPGLVAAGPLPDPCGLATVYSAAIVQDPQAAPAAAVLLDLLCGDATAAERRRAGFEALDDPDRRPAP